MTEDDVQVMDRVTPYRGYCRLDVYRFRHRVFDQGWTDEVSREVVERGHAVGVLPYDPVRDEVVLIEQFRIGAYAAPGFPAWQIECVAGMIDPGQLPEEAAVRETAEETGLQVEKLVPAIHYLSSPGMTSETVNLFVGQVDATGAGGLHGLAHEHEFIRVFALPSDDAVDLPGRAEVGNSMTIIALQWLKLHRERLRAEWLGVGAD